MKYQNVKLKLCLKEKHSFPKKISLFLRKLVIEYVEIGKIISKCELMSVTKWDKILIVSIVMFSMIGLFIVKEISVNSGNLYLVIEVEGKEYKKISLDANKEKELIEINSEEGHNLIEIEGSSVRIAEADCKDQLCVKMGWLDRANQISICLPNRVSIKLITNKSDVDIISY